jgi:hypothetical protein
VEKELQILIGEKNIVNIYFPKAEAEMHMGVANVELLNAHVYKKFVKKSHKIQHKYVRFNPHPRSLDGIAAPSDEALREWGFHDVNMALVNTDEAIENATAVPKRRAGTNEEISSLVKEAIAVGSSMLKQEI